MLKLPKGLKKKKKGKKSKKGKKDEELFTEEELEQYRREHQQQAASEPANENEEWSKFKDLTSGIDTVLKQTTNDLDRIKSTSFFQRVAPKKPDPPPPKPKPSRPVVEVTEADFPHLAAAAAAAAAAEEGLSSCAATDDESEEDDGDDIFDTSYVDAVERGELKLTEVPDSPTEFQDDDIFDTSHVDALIKGPEQKTPKKEGKKSVDIGLAVGVLTGRIDNVTVAPTRRKRVVPGDLLLESTDVDCAYAASVSEPEPAETSILDLDSDVPITTPIDLSVSLHTSLLQQSKRNSQEDLSLFEQELAPEKQEEEEVDEFALLAAESLEASAEVVKLEKEIKFEPVLQESWSAFDADKSESVFAECIVEDQIDVVDPYIDQDDPFDTSFADAVVPVRKEQQVIKEAVILEDDDDFDPRAEEIQAILNNRRQSSVRIHITSPSGYRESITSDDKEVEESTFSRDLLAGSTTDLTQLGDSPLNPVDINDTEIDPFDTSIVDKIVPGKVELKLLERELIEDTPAPVPVFRVPSDPDFDPRAEEKDESTKGERRASRPENLFVGKTVGFNVDGAADTGLKGKPSKPVTPYYTRELSITEDKEEEAEAGDTLPSLTRTRSDEDLAPKQSYQAKRRHSEFPGGKKPTASGADLLHGAPADLPVKVLTPTAPKRPPPPQNQPEPDPFDTSAVGPIAPSKTELRLLAKEFSCEETNVPSGEPDLLEPHDDIFQAKALTPEPSDAAREPEEDYDPFDTSFAGDLNPGRTELKLLESEFLN